jgi:DNA-binding CsgD family transcriptional regulator
MDEGERLSLLIGATYDAALDPQLWPNVLAQAAAFVGGISACLYAKDAAARSGNIFYDDGVISRRFIELYFTRYVKLDPVTTGHFFAQLDEPLATADLIAYDEFLETRFYKEWAKPQQLVDHVSVVLDKAATSVALFGVFRHEREGIVDAETRRRMKLIAPHVRRAVLIGRAIDLKAVEAASLAETLDSLSAGLFLVDRQGRVIHANAAGHALLAAGDVLANVGGRLAACDASTDRLLHEIFTAAGEGDIAMGSKGIAVPLIGRNNVPYVIHALPLTSGARRHGGRTYAAAAALFVHKAALQTPSAPEAIARAFGLTPTELRVLLALVEVGAAPAVAEALGVSTETVKTHLGRLYQKIGVGRQADLVKVVAGFAGPLA